MTKTNTTNANPRLPYFQTLSVHLPRPATTLLVQRSEIITSITETRYLPPESNRLGLASVVSRTSNADAAWTQARNNKLRQALPLPPPSLQAQNFVTEALNEYQAYQRASRGPRRNQNTREEACQHLVLAYRNLMGFRRIVSRGVLADGEVLGLENQIQALERNLFGNHPEITAQLLRSFEQVRSARQLANTRSPEIMLKSSTLQTLAQRALRPEGTRGLNNAQTLLYRYLQSQVTPATESIPEETNRLETLLNESAELRDFIRSHPHDVSNRSKLNRFQSLLAQISNELQRSTYTETQRHRALAKLDEFSNFSTRRTPYQTNHDTQLGLFRRDHVRTFHQAQLLNTRAREAMTHLFREMAEYSDNIYLGEEIANQARLRIENSFSEAKACLEVFLSLPETHIPAHFRLAREQLSQNLAQAEQDLASARYGHLTVGTSLTEERATIASILNERTGETPHYTPLDTAEIPALLRSAENLLGQNFEFERTQLGWGSRRQSEIYYSGTDALSTGRVFLNPRNMGLAFSRCRQLHEVYGKLIRIQDPTEVQEEITSRVQREMLRMDMGLRERGFEYNNGSVRAIHAHNYDLAIREATRVHQRETLERAIATLETAAQQCAEGIFPIARENLEHLYLNTFRSLAHQPSLQREIFNGTSIYTLALLRNCNDREIRRWMGMLSEGYVAM